MPFSLADGRRGRFTAVARRTDGLHAIGHAVSLAGSMTGQVTWSLILGFTLAAIVKAVIRRETIVGLLGEDRPKTLAVATGALSG